MDRRTPRRFRDIDYNQKLKFDNKFRNDELSKYILFDLTPKLCNQYLDDHIDYIYLMVLCGYKDRFFDKYSYQKILDTIDGYIFAYNADLIDAVQLCKKLNFEIIDQWLHPNRIFNQIAVYTK